MKVDDYKRKFFDSSVADILRAIHGGSLIGGFTLTFCSIGALSEIYRNGDFAESRRKASHPGCLLSLLKKSNVPLEMEGNAAVNLSNFYRKWVQKWFKKAGRKKPHEWFLYAVRCALTHTYGPSDELQRNKISGYSLQHRKPELHLTSAAKKQADTEFKPGYVLNLETFVAEFIVAACCFFDDMDNLNGEDRETLLKRLDKLIDIYDPNDNGNPNNRLNPPKTYAQMHIALASLDSGTPNVKTIEAAIDNLYQS